MEKTIIISEKYNIKIDIKEVGDDLLVLVAGGDRPHIGAVSAGISKLDGAAVSDLAGAHAAAKEAAGAELYQGEAGSRKKSGLFTLAFPTHRDNFLSDPIASELSKRLNKNVVVLSGVHVDNISKEGIGEIVDMIPDIVNAVTDVML